VEYKQEHYTHNEGEYYCIERGNLEYS
jgi:hypothetical protein